MEANAKKVSIVIIIILIVIIGGLWYIGNKKNNPTIPKIETNLLTATSTDLGFDIKTYASGRNNIEQIIIEKLDAGISTSSIITPLTKIIPFSANKIITSNNTSPANLKIYGQQIAKALAPYSNDKEDEIATMISALEQKNSIKALSLLTTAQVNKQIISDLLKISVPKTAVTVHLNLINSLNKNTTLLTDMSKILDNPYLALQSANIYRVEKLNFYNAITDINKFFKTNNIIFSPEEGSKVYLNI